MDLRLDLESRLGVAQITLGSPTFPRLWLAVGDLQIERVEGPTGPLPFVLTGDPAGGRRLEIAFAEPPQSPLSLEVRYRFKIHDHFDGLLASQVTFLWPYHCGNLFPCDPDPADGFTLRLQVDGVPAGQTLVAPESLVEPAPPYMPAFAVGPYTFRSLGVTEAGTEIGVWTLPGTEQQALTGAADLLPVFDWYETTYGPYLFGDRAASVVVDWPSGGFGGMEHHPFWHIARASIGDPVTHAHEAAHGWFGNGVRLRCWEDFALSEGLATYLAARALEAVRGAAEGERIWNLYRSRLEAEVRKRDTEAWPTTCDQIDILEHPLWSLIPYLKGAFFLRAVEREVGREKLDGALRELYAKRAGEAASVEDLVETIRQETGFDPGSLVQLWLRGRGIPED